jgi:catalase
VLQDAYVLQKMQHFSRERVPERVARPVAEHPLERSAS